MKAHYDITNNKILGWYSETIHKNIPAPIIEVTRGQWQTAIQNGHNKVNINGTTEKFDFRTADEIKEANFKDINFNYETQVKALTDGVPNSEIQTWTKQESEARAWKVDNLVSTPLIDAIVLNRPRYTKAQLVDKIIEKADLYAQAVGQLTGIRQHEEDNL